MDIRVVSWLFTDMGLILVLGAGRLERYPCFDLNQVILEKRVRLDIPEFICDFERRIEKAQKRQKDKMHVLCVVNAGNVDADKCFGSFLKDCCWILYKGAIE